MRRFTQFSIRALLILMLAVACWCGGWQAATWKAERDKQEAIRQAKEDARKAMETTVPPKLGQPIPQTRIRVPPIGPAPSNLSFGSVDL